MKNYVEEIRKFVKEQLIIKIANVSSMGFGNDNRINLVITSLDRPSDKLLNYKSDAYTMNYMEDNGKYIVTFVGLNNDYTIESIKAALKFL